LSESDDLGRDIVIRVMAEADAKRIDSYIDRGRRYANLRMEDLCNTFIGAYRRWASDVHDPASVEATNDVGAEYTLRGEIEPFELVEPEVEIIISTVGARFGETSSERRAEINQLMVDDYLVMQRNEH
jgi:hypothetical protein